METPLVTSSPSSGLVPPLGCAAGCRLSAIPVDFGWARSTRSPPGTPSLGSALPAGRWALVPPPAGLEPKGSTLLQARSGGDSPHVR